MFLHKGGDLGQRPPLLAQELDVGKLGLEEDLLGLETGAAVVAEGWARRTAQRIGDFVAASPYPKANSLPIPKNSLCVPVSRNESR